MAIVFLFQKLFITTLQPWRLYDCLWCPYYEYLLRLPYFGPAFFCSCNFAYFPPFEHPLLWDYTSLVFLTSHADHSNAALRGRSPSTWIKKFALINLAIVVLSSAQYLCLNLLLFQPAKLLLHSYQPASLGVAWSLKLQPVRNSFPTGTDFASATKGSFNQISIILFISKTQGSKAGVKPASWERLNST